MRFETYKISFSTFVNKDAMISKNTIKAAKIIDIYGNKLEVKLANEPKTTFRHYTGYDLVQENGLLYAEYPAFGYKYRIVSIGNTIENMVEMNEPEFIKSTGIYVPLINMTISAFREHAVLIHTNDKKAILANTEFKILEIIDIKKEGYYKKLMDAKLQNIKEAPLIEELL